MTRPRPFRLLLRRLAPPLPAALLPVLLAPPTWTRNEVHVVDPANRDGTEFTSLQAAIDAAAEGDILLLRPIAGAYPGLTTTIVGKSVALVADGVARVDGSLTVSGLQAGQSVLLSGLQNQDGTLELLGNAGEVRLQDVELVGPFTFPPQPGPPTLTIRGCASVVLLDCVVRGGLLGGDDAVVATDSLLHIAESVLEGSEGAPGDVFSPPTEGGAGLVLDGGFAHLLGSSALGGTGGLGQFNLAFGCVDGGAGGAGIRLVGAAPRLVLRETSAQGGAGGVSENGSPSCSNGPDGPDLDVRSGSAETLPGPARRLTSPAVARRGETLSVGFEGLTGEAVFYGFSVLPGTLYLNGLGGSLMLLSPLVSGAGGLASPTLEIQFPAGGLPQGEEGILFHQQGAFFLPGRGVLLSGGRSLLVLEEGLF